MTTSFYNGISGINTYQTGVDVIADNISNVDITGFKGSSAEFSTIFSKNLSTNNSSDVGLGVKLKATSLNTSQGALQNTDSVFDLALNSEGWFGVKGADNQLFYTRDGEFGKDGSGNLTSLSGNYLMGTASKNIAPAALNKNMLNAFGLPASSLTNTYAVSNIEDVPLGSTSSQSIINLPDFLYFPALPTTKISTKGNLDPAVKTGLASVALNSADISSSVDTANQTISISGTVSNTKAVLNAKLDDKALITITDINGKSVKTNASLDSSLNWKVTDYDISNLDTTNALSVSATLQTNQEIPNVEHFTSKVISPDGEKDSLDMVFTKKVPQQQTGTTWNATVQVLGLAQTYDPATTYDKTKYKVDTAAKKVYPILDSKTGVLEFASNGELVSSTIPTLSNNGTPLTLNLGTAGTADGLVSNSNLNAMKSVQSNGYTDGIVKDYGMDNNGNVIAEFTNGRTVPIAKVAVYHFQNDRGLSKVSGTLFSASQNSGDAFFYTDSNGKPILGTKISSNKLEGSNVNLSTALTELIIMQKAFDASSKSITTSDELIKNAINMKS